MKKYLFYRINIYSTGNLICCHIFLASCGLEESNRNRGLDSWEGRLSTKRIENEVPSSIPSRINFSSLIFIANFSRICLNTFMYRSSKEAIVYILKYIFRCFILGLVISYLQFWNIFLYVRSPLIFNYFAVLSKA